MTPLRWGVRSGDGEAVELFLGWGAADTDKPNDVDKTLLFGATMEGHESVVKRISNGQDVNPNKPDSGGVAPPSWVVIEKHYRSRWGRALGPARC